MNATGSPAISFANWSTAAPAAAQYAQDLLEINSSTVKRGAGLCASVARGLTAPSIPKSRNRAKTIEIFFSIFTYFSFLIFYLDYWEGSRLPNNKSENHGFI